MRVFYLKVMKEKKLTIYEFPTIKGDDIDLVFKVFHNNKDFPLHIEVNDEPKIVLEISRFTLIKIKQIINEAL